MNLWLKKSCVCCWSWNTGQETPDVPNSIIYVAINKNTSITVIPWFGKQYYDPHKHTGQVSTSLPQLHFTSTNAECTAWGKIFSLLLEQPLHIGDWCQRTKKIHLKITTPVFVFFCVVTTQVLSTETVQVRVGQTRIQDPILLVATMSMTQQMRQE